MQPFPLRKSIKMASVNPPNHMDIANQGSRTQTMSLIWPMKIISKLWKNNRKIHCKICSHKKCVKFNLTIIRWLQILWKFCELENSKFQQQKKSLQIFCPAVITIQDAPNKMPLSINWSETYSRVSLQITGPDPEINEVVIYLSNSDCSIRATVFTGQLKTTPPPQNKQHSFWEQAACWVFFLHSFTLFVMCI